MIALSKVKIVALYTKKTEIEQRQIQSKLFIDRA